VGCICVQSVALGWPDVGVRRLGAKDASGHVRGTLAGGRGRHVAEPGVGVIAVVHVVRAGVPGYHMSVV